MADEISTAADSGIRLVIIDEDDIPTTLNNKDGALAFTDGVTVEMRTGAADDAIELPSLQKQEGGSVPYLLAQSDAGALMAWMPEDSCKPKVLVAQDGVVKFVDWEAPVCYDTEDICEDCDPEFVAGFSTQEDCEGNEKLCLIRFTVEKLAELIGVPDEIVFADTNCAEIEGNGTEENPIKVLPKISPDAGNILECRENGLYVGCCYYGGSDPLSEV